MKELTNFLEDEGFYSDEKRQVKISVSIEELRVIINGLKEYIEAMKEYNIFNPHIKFVESLHSDLVATLNLELENVI